MAEGGSNRTIGRCVVKRECQQALSTCSLAAQALRFIAAAGPLCCATCLCTPAAKRWNRSSSLVAPAHLHPAAHPGAERKSKRAACEQRIQEQL